MWADFYFLSPAWLFTLIPIFIWFLSTRHKALLLPSALQPLRLFYPLLMALTPTQHKEKPQNSRLWLGLIFILLSISIAQPAFKTPIKTAPSTKQNVDLILVVNTSVSMVLRDYKEKDAQGNEQQFDRMEKTRQVLKQLIAQFKGKQIGVVVLGRPAALWLPLTDDINQVQHVIGQLKTTLGGRTSDMGAALKLVNERFNQPSSNKKMVLLVNDGYLQIGSISPIQSIEQLVKNNFVVHTLAIGSPKRPDFSLGIGHLIYSPVDLKLMQSLAQAGNGSMVHAWQNKTAKALISTIDYPNVNAKQTPTRFKKLALYFYPLGLAMILFLIMLFPINHLSLKSTYDE